VLRPSIRLPLWAALAIVGAAYVLRSVVIRGGDFSLSPLDLLVVALFAFGALAASLARRSESTQTPSREANHEGHGEDRDARE